MIEGLKEVEATLRAKSIPFHLLRGNPVENITAFVSQHKAVCLVTDFSPLRVPLSWVNSVAARLDSSSAAENLVPFVQIDAHNIVPVWVASSKLEYSARTIRSKIDRLIPQYLKPIPAIDDNAAGSLHGCELTNWVSALASLEINREVGPVDWIKPGATAARAVLESFGATRLKDYASMRNNPNKNSCSNLSPYFHFGTISAQQAVIHIKSLRRLVVL